MAYFVNKSFELETKVKLWQNITITLKVTTTHAMTVPKIIIKDQKVGRSPIPRNPHPFTEILHSSHSNYPTIKTNHSHTLWPLSLSETTTFCLWNVYLPKYICFHFTLVALEFFSCLKPRSLPWQLVSGTRACPGMWHFSLLQELYKIWATQLNMKFRLFINKTAGPKWGCIC